MVFGWFRRRRKKDVQEHAREIMDRYPRTIKALGSSPVKSQSSIVSSRDRRYDDSGTPDPTPFTPTWDAGDSYSSSSCDSGSSSTSSDSSGSSDSGGSCGGGSD